MKFTIHRKPLFEALQKLQSVVEKKNTVQILGNILCTVQDRVLSLCATDLEVGIKITLPIENPENGKITLSAKNFFDIVRELPDKDLHITRKDNNWVELLSGKSKFNIVSLAADEYPALPPFEEKTYLESRTQSLSNMIDRTHFAVATDATRYHLSGVFFEPQENGIMRMVGCDGHRLSFVDSEVFLKSPELKRGVIIPKKGLMEIRKLLSESGDTIGLSIEKGYVFVKTNDVYLFVRLIDGEYPDYRPVIPKQADKVVKVDRENLTAALKRVSLLAHEKSKGVKLSIQKDLLTFTSSNPDMGEAREEIDVDYSNDALEIGFNSRYFLDFLSVTDSETIEFHVKDRLSPGILKGSSQSNHTYVIMPMRI